MRLVKAEKVCVVKEASFFTMRLETKESITSLNRFNIIRLPSKQVCLYDKLCSSPMGNGFNQIPIVFWSQMTHRRGCYAQQLLPNH